VAALTGLSSGARLWVPGPLAGTMNLFAAVLARHLGVPLVGRRDATHAHLTPTALRRLLDEGGPDRLHVTVAGDRLERDLHDRAVAAGLSVSHYYGAAELSFVAWGHHEDDLRPFPEVQVAVRDGIVWVRSPYLCRGYDGQPGALRTDPAGYLTVGDRGMLRGGVLTVRGRGENAVVTGGATVEVADVEQVLSRHVHGEAVVLGLSHETLGQVVAAVLTDSDDLSAARAAARARLDPAQRPRLWFHVADLPTPAAGKVDRVRLAGSLQRPGVTALTEDAR
jgi:acyl-CoA synthetase (AMP-forming)/AMP-acid ligase II